VSLTVKTAIRSAEGVIRPSIPQAASLARVSAIFSREMSDQGPELGAGPLPESPGDAGELAAADCVRLERLEPAGLPLTVFRLHYLLTAEPDALALSRLTPEERERMARFRFVEDRVRFAGARSALRALLAARLGLAPDSVPLAHGNNGKPVLDPAFELHFNVSHSGAEGLLAISDAGAVGVDVERHRADIDYRGIAERMFAAAEVSELDGLDDAEARHRFYRGWVYKEAVLKALALGIGSDTKIFAVLERNGLKVSAAPGSLAVRPERLRVVPLPAPGGYSAALAFVADEIPG
jgi:4'-phosphopantetheinyl transferase